MPTNQQFEKQEFTQAPEDGTSGSIRGPAVTTPRFQLLPTGSLRIQLAPSPGLDFKPRLSPKGAPAHCPAPSWREHCKAAGFSRSGVSASDQTMLLRPLVSPCSLHVW